MAVSGDFRCRECGVVREFWFDGPCPATHSMGAHADGEGDRCPGTFDRVWSAPHLGRMSSGEPAR
jgi:hypothetical protein